MAALFPILVLALLPPFLSAPTPSSSSPSPSCATLSRSPTFTISSLLYTRIFVGHACVGPSTICPPSTLYYGSLSFTLTNSALSPAAPLNCNAQFIDLNDVYNTDGESPYCQAGAKLWLK